MPIYEYACKACGFEKDVLQKLSDSPLTQCPSCEEQTFSKRISAAGFRLKGSGWYETDFKTGKKKNLAQDSKSSADAG
ncbi:FmdB family zinc ribbon protein [Alkalimarinus sediminis]|uniref:Zinc ribbon domain-containing protein n=1 Tax=Alkalimarinus sediminis TaxID=1632866 RepID=A0A9E8HMU6_9ALTE|nr:zinc ribbon domain-containing protein [Alkalimarinus sediminis]UZW75811.1 zinc ribbon domain-containing protein [Alkalimarinus sediminis]